MTMMTAEVYILALLAMAKLTLWAFFFVVLGCAAESTVSWLAYKIYRNNPGRARSLKSIMAWIVGLSAFLIVWQMVAQQILGSLVSRIP
jgi:hypothetical protein